MSLSGPTYRLDEEKLAIVVPQLVAAATEVSHRLGWGQRRTAASLARCSVRSPPVSLVRSVLPRRGVSGPRRDRLDAPPRRVARSNGQSSAVVLVALLAAGGLAVIGAAGIGAYFLFGSSKPPVSKGPPPAPPVDPKPTAVEPVEPGPTPPVVAPAPKARLDQVWAIRPDGQRARWPSARQDWRNLMRVCTREGRERHGNEPTDNRHAGLFRA